MSGANDAPLLRHNIARSIPIFLLRRNFPRSSARGAWPGTTVLAKTTAIHRGADKGWPEEVSFVTAMNRREFVGSGVALGIYSTQSGFAAPFLQAETAKPAAVPRDASPKWLSESPIVMAGCWDSFPLFQLRVGGSPVWMEELYKRQGSTQTVKALKDAGVTLAVIHFFKGFGLKAEHEHIEVATALARLLHQNGIRVGLYVGSTIGFETFLLEEPEAEAWFAPDFMGKPLVYGDQTFRRRVYFMHPGYRAYIKRVIRYGIENLHADLIHFDNTSMQAAPAIFQHPMAITDFRSHLKAKYNDAQMKQRLGFSDVSRVVAPLIAEVPPELNDPLFQEFAEFRCHQLAAYYAEMLAYIRSLNPEVAADNNPSSGISGRNLIWEQGVDYPRLLQGVDIAWTEEGDAATVTTDGVLVSKIRTYKAAAILKKHIFTYTWGATGNWGYEDNSGGLLQMAESMAYNRQCLGMVGEFDAIRDLPSQPRRYIQFFHDNFALYRDVETVPDVALLHSFASVGFNEGRPNTSFMLAAQTLIQSRFLFDVIFDQHLENLAKYRVLLLADQESLSDHQIDLIRAYTEAGGSLVATAYTSLFNERRERRRDFGLKDCFGISAPPWRGAHSPVAPPPGPPVERTFGKGRSIYLPQIVPSIAKRPEPGRRQPHRWGLPANHDVLRNALLSALRQKPTVETSSIASNYVTAELVSQPGQNRLVLHLLNYDHVRTPSLQNLHVGVTIPAGKKVQKIRAFSPDWAGASQELRWSGAQVASFEIPSLSVYTVVALDFDN